MMNKTIEVDNISNFEFWVGMFMPRSKKWRKETLRRLRGKKSIFETDKERNDKIKALEFLQG